MFNATTERRLTSWVSPERPERRRQGTGTHARATPTVLPERGDSRPGITRTDHVATLRRSVALALATGCATVTVGTICVSPASGSGSGCDYGAQPPAAIKPRLRQDGFTYLFLHCIRFGTAYYAFADNTSDAKHPTLRERVLVVARTRGLAASAAAYFRSTRGRASFLGAFKAFVSRTQDAYMRQVRLLGVSLHGTIVRIEAIARGSPR